MILVINARRLGWLIWLAGNDTDNYRTYNYNHRTCNIGVIIKLIEMALKPQPKTTIEQPNFPQAISCYFWYIHRSDSLIWWKLIEREFKHVKQCSNPDLNAYEPNLTKPMKIMLNVDSAHIFLYILTITKIANIIFFLSWRRQALLSTYLPVINLRDWL